MSTLQRSCEHVCSLVSCCAGRLGTGGGTAFSGSANAAGGTFKARRNCSTVPKSSPAVGAGEGAREALCGGARLSVGQPLAAGTCDLPGYCCSLGAAQSDYRSPPVLESRCTAPLPHRRNVFLVGQHPGRKQPGQVHSPGIGVTFREPPNTLPRMEMTRSRPTCFTFSACRGTRPSITR